MTAERVGPELSGSPVVERVGADSAGGVRVERLTGESGTGPEQEQVWLVGDDEECVAIGAPTDGAAVLAAVGQRQLTALLHTHLPPGAAAVAAALLDARPRLRIGVHDEDLEAWRVSQPDLEPNLRLSNGDIITSGDIELTVLHTPGPGSCCFHAPDLGVLFSGVADVRRLARLRDLDPQTVVHPARGPSTTLERLLDASEHGTGTAPST